MHQTGGLCIGILIRLSPMSWLWSAIIQLRAGQREGIFVMQPAKDRFGSDGIRLSAAMARIGDREDEGADRRIGTTGTQRHVWASAVVMGDPGL
jgi:hypothetical protein